MTSSVNEILKNHKTTEEPNDDLLNRFIQESTNDSSKIGKLQSEISAVIHTKQAAILIQGKLIEDQHKKSNTKRAVIGLYKFASMASILESNIKKDDPFADYIFYNFHEEIINERAKLKAKLATFKNWINSKVPSNLSLNESMNVRPLEMKFKFNSALAFQLSYLILEQDEYFRLLKLAQHIAVIDSNQANDNINENMRDTRRIMNMIYLYKTSNATRSDHKANNQVWKRACEMMPQLVLPESILTGEKRSALAPFINLRPEEQTSEMVDKPSQINDQTTKDKEKITETTA